MYAKIEAHQNLDETIFVKSPILPSSYPPLKQCNNSACQEIKECIKRQPLIR